MIDWPFVAIHFLWIFGLSIIVASVSYHDWRRREIGLSWQAAWRQATVRRPIAIGSALAALGIALSLLR